MRVEVVSIIAACYPSRDFTWSGEVELPDDPEVAFRFFNRVDGDDADRLEEIGYGLPSLTMGDFIRLGDSTYRVEARGFTKITCTLPLDLLR